MNTALTDGMFAAGATVISHLIGKGVQAAACTASVTETSLTTNTGWVILAVDIPGGNTSFIARFESQSVVELVKIMMGGDELGAIGDSMTSEITSQIAGTMAEALATANGWQTAGIAARLIAEDKEIAAPPLHTCMSRLEIEGGISIGTAVDFDVPTAATVGFLVHDTTPEPQAEAAPAAQEMAHGTMHGAPHSKAAPHAAAFTPMTPNATKPKEGSSLELVHDVPMTVRALLGSSRLQLREVVNMHAGTVFELNRSSEEPIDLYVNNILVARGEVVVVEDRYAVKISELNPESTAAR